MRRFRSPPRKARRVGRVPIGHELAHVVQQREGRAQAGAQYKGGVVDDPALEHEADVAGARAAGGDADARYPQVAALVRNRVGATALRNLLSANPGLGAEIPAFLAAGGDPALNQVMAAAFPAVAATSEPASEDGPGKAEKAPTDPTQPLPAQRTGSKALSKGVMKWTLKADDHETADIKVDFKPDESKVEAKTVSFVQTVISKVGAGFAYGGGTATDPGKKKDVYQPFEEPTSKKRVDHFPGGENDPFYGAEWDQAGKKWKQERASWKLGSSKKGDRSTSATMTDTPDAPESRMGLGDTSSEFETVPVVLETREPLGSLYWGYKIPDTANSKIELLGGKDADCKDTPSDDWGKTLDQFYAAKFETILDEFEIAKADLKPDHKTKLDGVVTRMKASMALKVQLGGACDHTGDESFNQKLALQRAQNARDYLIEKGIAAGRIEVESYSFEWARVEAERGKSEGKNRRVQVWLHP